MMANKKAEVSARVLPHPGRHRAPSNLRIRARSWGKRGANLLLLVALLTAGVAVGQATGAGYLYPASADNPIAQSGCVIRFDEKTSSGNTRPTIHANSTHACVGILSVSADYARGAVRIELDTAGPVMSMSVSLDETFAQRGYSCGGRGGMGTAWIYCYDRQGRQVKAHSSAIYGKLANLWFSLTAWDRSAA